ncbi:two-component sensor histidine kinase [[Clostridium] sordellii]|uniref:sensor histidine kinase n=1 Tax=Paraclostridium sordellii TaxID=1505 RepID=UPI0005DD4990|nr:HAMP domain-containing sensor histidine kinase [Paeniclostridium sordellii]MDU1455809.1 HAMP domain-containing sensor histidine kinase [Paeniclostridium sordellii]CEN22967.1 two-component sensor histidine kinase [[Clostridium] sordellii] [Paeniclostridium sordellii]CEN31255.1 two-component sensor histidine kinase [[Clostridium] sordellii] [Paeniclostridium sordellii]CEN95398.1 two-component sensor histidine kinase [[Clostridium] sordellii] [Paeniclostridium sordellii]CEO04623.1 two-componen
MIKIREKWEYLPINRKIFVIITTLSIGLVLTVYLILYFLLPSYYQRYKIKSLDNRLSIISARSRTSNLHNLKESLSDLSQKENLGILLRDVSGKVEFGNRELMFLPYANSVGYSYKDFKKTMVIYTKDSISPYFLDISMPLQPIDEATTVILDLMPIILGVAIVLSIIASYVFSKWVTKPLINIIENERMQEAKRKEFIATISHELKTPITIISGQLEGMIYNIGKYKDRDTYLKKSYDSTQELKNLVEEMIQISKFEILEKKSEVTDINLTYLINRLIKRQIDLIEVKDIILEVKMDENITIRADEERIAKAINNIINNAIKYSPENANLNIKLYKKENPILEIENTGVSIDEKHKEKLFKPFYRVEKSRNRKTGGSGLGLYIVSQILREHGFKYNIKNGKNSVVFIIEFIKN